MRFRRVGTSSSDSYGHFYLASYRTYASYDRYLKTGPYHLGWRRADRRRRSSSRTRTDCWSTTGTRSTSTTTHRCTPAAAWCCRSTPIRPRSTIRTADPWRGRIQTYDAPFSLERADSLVLRHNGRPSYVRGAAAQPLFDDTRSYWNAELPNVGVKTANAGVTLRVVAQSGTSMTVQVGSVGRRAGPTLTLGRGQRKRARPQRLLGPGPPPVPADHAPNTLGRRE